MDSLLSLQHAEHWTYAAVKSDAFNEFANLSTRFESHHQDGINILIHMIATPMGIIGVANLLRLFTRGSTAGMVIGFAYMLSLMRVLPIGVFIGTFIIGIIIGVSPRFANIGFRSSLALIAAGYVLQDMVHYATKEETFQSTYSGANGHVDFTNLEKWGGFFLEQVWYLIPLIVQSYIKFNLKSSPWLEILMQPLPGAAQQIYTFAYVLTPLVLMALGSYCLDSKNAFCFFPGTPYFSRVIQCDLVTGDTDCRREDMAKIRAYAIDQSPAHDTSSHYWHSTLPKEHYEQFNRVANSSIIVKGFRQLFSDRHYALEVVEGMNEIYVTGPTRVDEDNNSDHVFYQRHLDGPLGFIPYVSVYRCIVGMDKNMMVTTHFPIAGVSKNCCEGELIGFDFNREIHYISMDESKRDISDEFRVVLKLHYCVYPRILAPLGWLMHQANVRYDQAFRALFLKTIRPTTPYEHFLAWNVVANTALFDAIETFIGQRSLFYLIFSAVLWYITGCYEVFFVMTSFVHYLRYITTYYLRRGIDFGSFKRDVLLFKTMALGQLAYVYLFPHRYGGGNAMPFQFDFISVAMIVSGYAVSMMATKALGVDRTYFGAELGLYPPKWITEFPYGYIPHPMITSQIWALLGIYKANHFRAVSPLVVPMHIILYSIHMLQEEFDIYDKTVVFPTLPAEEDKKTD